MDEDRNITCVVCPAGCNISVRIEDGKVVSVSGNRCKKGADYACAECINPVRTLTSTVRVTGGIRLMLPVKSDRPMPKGLLLECMKHINRCTVQAPVKIGDVVIENLLDTGINIVAAGGIEAKEPDREKPAPIK